MRVLVRNCLCTAALIGGFLASAQASDVAARSQAANPVATGPWFQLFGGYTPAPDSWYVYGGGVAALHQNLYRDGWLVRMAGGFGRYEYNIVPGLGNAVNFQTGEFMVGYQTFLGNNRLTGYVGANVENHDNDKDPLAKVKGTKWGVKGQAEILAPLNQYWYVYALGTISSVWNNYFVLGKVGYNVTPWLSFGPEVMALGNERYDAVRTGPFLGFKIAQSVDLIFSGGYTWDQRSDSVNDHSGVYGSVHLRGTF